MAPRMRTAIVVLMSVGALACGGGSGASGGGAGGGSAGGGSSGGGSQATPFCGGCLTVNQYAIDAGSGAGFTNYQGTGCMRRSDSEAAIPQVSEEITFTGVPGCSMVAEGACRAIRCKLTGASPGTGASTVVKSVSAGNATVTGGQLASPFALNTTGGCYEGASTNGFAFVPGDTLTFSAPGKQGEVGPVMGSVKAPEAISVTSPVISGSKLAFSRAKALDVAFAGSTHTELYLSFLVSEQSTNTFHVVSCFFPPGGSGQVPAAVLATLPKVDASSSAKMGSFLMAAKSTQVVQAGECSVKLNLVNPMLQSGSFTTTD